METKKKNPYASLKIKEFKSFLSLRFAMVFAWSMQFVVIEWKVYSITKDPLSLGLIGLMEIVPALAVALFAGHFVDQNEKRKLLVRCILAFSLVSLVLVYLTSSLAEDRLEQNAILYGIYACVFVGGIVRSFISPTIFSLMGLIVPRENYGNAATWSSSVWQMASVLGPTLGGFTILWMGTSGSLAVVLAFSLLAFILVMGIAPKPIMNEKIGEPILSSLKEGVKFVFQTREILGAISLDMVAVLFGGAVALLPIFATDILHVGSWGFGFLRAAPAVGSFLTIVSIAYFPIAKKAGIKLLAAIFGFGLSIILFGLSEWFYLSLFALFMSGVTDGFSVVIRNTILQLYTPDDMRGRVSSVNSMFVGSSNELGAFESGITAKLFGTVRAVVGGGIITLIIVLFVGKRFPRLRNLEFPEET